MEFNVKEIRDRKEKEEIAREILNDLPEWFGLPESTEEYISCLLYTSDAADDCCRV